ncbi:sensor histidine kinase [Promicromonospora citrea]|uniref:histidine kinase n=1 Tax=Promicromonospora citrea TaxID=43677 RepID=A0A8H9GF97_9MICO|nr:histidine kinase [Promicromonospora citrea]NNH53687.1 sensor histidine kinase [Promicromonospora citrea]GGM10484.1 hypothetical protein GCM10010102_02900 [Promicromonospora citrea]
MLGTIRPARDADPVAPGSLDRPRARLFVAVAVALVGVVGSLAAGRNQPWAAEPGLLALLLLLVSPAALVVFLPRRPVLATVTAVAATLGFLLLGHPWGPVFAGPVAVLAGVVLTGGRRARLIGWAGAALLAGGGAAAAVLTAPRVERYLRDDPTRVPDDRWGPPGPAGHGPPWVDDGAWFLSLGSLVAGAAWLAVALLVASAMRDRIARRLAAEVAARETAAERERTAVASERLRIARELHDVLAHSLSAINVQAGVGLHLLEKQPGQAREALTNIRATSQEALTEVREVLGIVRDGASAAPPGAPAPDDGPRPGWDAAAPLAPTWDRTALDRLVEQARADGLAVTADVGPGLDELPDRLAGVVHRVVQESLTNVRRHARTARRVTVRVTRTDGLEVVVTDDGEAPRTAPEPGYGLVGMRERVEAAGGTLAVGPRADGPGWQVRAALPLPRDAVRPTETGETA